MTSTRFIFIFLGFIFLIFIILSSSRISGAIQKRFGPIFPPLKLFSVTPTPTPAPKPTFTPTPTSTPGFYNPGGTSTPSTEIPATGPELASLLFLSGSFLTGIYLKRRTKSIKE